MNTEPIDERYYCMTCNTPFENVIYGVSRAVETVDRVNLHHGVPVVSPRFAEGIGIFCCQACRDQGMAEVLKQDNVVVPAQEPDIGPVETCARCSGPVQTSEPHCAYTADVVRESGGYAATVIDLRYLAVVCPTCQLPKPFPGSSW